MIDGRSSLDGLGRQAFAPQGCAVLDQYGGQEGSLVFLAHVASGEQKFGTHDEACETPALLVLPDGLPFFRPSSAIGPASRVLADFLNTCGQGRKQGERGESVAFVAGIEDQRVAVGQDVVEREVVAVFRIIGIEGGAELRLRIFLCEVEAFAVIQVELGRLVDTTAKET